MFNWRQRMLMLSFSTAARHICNRKDWFSKFRATARSSVYSADDSKEALVAPGVGTVEVTLYCGAHGTLNTRLQNVLYVPKCRRNLISVSSLEKTGDYVVIKNKLARIYDVETKALIADACARGGLYVLRAKIRGKNGMALNVERIDGDLWHKRFCHVSNKVLEKTARHSAVSGLVISGNVQPPACTDCIVGKCTQNKCVPSKRRQTSRVLELVHSDICGPMPVKSHGGALYFMTIVDDFSRKVIVMCLKAKSEAAKRLMEFIRMAECQTGQKVKTIRTDNGLEYCGTIMSSFFKKSGIKHERSNLETPQMNGVAERVNRTLMDLVRSMLKPNGLPK
ncbi:hypothetical protein M514_26377 [Trichuris suis]|uniref:Integrase catalytic domain-containing protein n=1 Tax=Trichuris suis TaxID=68888 RepID=A0A085MW85_9BILA|nr:hypothetical protein M514_26377 [Trichuris suis]